MIQPPTTRLLLMLLLALFLSLPAPVDSQAESDDSKKAAIDLFVSHLRQHFDDIHDVSMRFHLHDPSLGGVIALHMKWEAGRLVSAAVEENETNSEAEAAALIEAIRTWNIEGLEDVSFTIPFRITMVGSDDPEFHRRAILTGTVHDPAGTPLPGALITLTPVEALNGMVPEIIANREGVFIRSLIPAGTWSVKCSLPGYRPQRRENVSLEAAEHRILRFELQPE